MQYSNSNRTERGNYEANGYPMQRTITEETMRFLSLSVCWYLFLVCSGCTREPLADSRNPHYIIAAKLMDQGKFQDSATAFQRCLRRSPNCVSVHLQLGLLYEDKLEQPLAAAYHYRQYLKMRPNANDAHAVQQWLRRVEKELCLQFSAALEHNINHDDEKTLVHPAVDPETSTRAITPRERRLAHRIRELNSEVLLLREVLAADRAKTSQFPPPPLPAPAAPDAARSAVLPAHPKKQQQHIVAKGDTLIKISRKCYGTDQYWTRIRDANAKVITGKNTLVPGMRLTIPAIGTDNQKDEPKG